MKSIIFSIHILLNQLLKKSAIKVDGFVQTGKNYGRTYTAAITPEDYQVMYFKTSTSYLQSSLPNITVVNFIFLYVRTSTVL